MKIFLSILFQSICISGVFCQIEIHNPPKFIYENDVLTNIEFQNAGTSKFDIQKNNPYNKLNHPVKSINTSGTKIYDLSHLKIRDIIKSSLSAVTINDSLLKIPMTQASSSFSFFSGENDIVVAYELNYYGIEGIIYSEGTIVVLDNKGSIVSTVEDIPYGCYSPRITKNGSFVAFLLGDIQAYSNFSLVGVMTFVIKDLASGRTIYELKGNSEFSIYEPVVHENLIIELIKVPGNQYEYQVFDPQKRIVYKKRYSREEIGELKAYTVTGFLFEDKSGTQKIDLFEDFKIEEIENRE